ncbi:MAG: hypothetical protein KAJ67_00825, partial [Gemmatimonadetes bacterium]|nr:hypothetical protein [Gemmatimonadota bacterium]
DLEELGVRAGSLAKLALLGKLPGVLEELFLLFARGNRARLLFGLSALARRLLFGLSALARHHRPRSCLGSSSETESITHAR